MVLYPSMDATGMLFVLNAVDGRLLTSFAAGASNACGASIVNGHVFTGSGGSGFGRALAAPGFAPAIATPPTAPSATGPPTTAPMLPKKGYTNFGLGNVGQRVTALTFTPALVKCGTLTCLACEDDGLKCKGSPW